MKNSVLVLFAILFAGQAWGQQTCTYQRVCVQTGNYSGCFFDSTSNHYYTLSQCTPSTNAGTYICGNSSCRVFSDDVNNFKAQYAQQHPDNDPCVTNPEGEDCYRKNNGAQTQTNQHAQNDTQTSGCPNGIAANNSSAQPGQCFQLNGQLMKLGENGEVSRVQLNNDQNNNSNNDIQVDKTNFSDPTVSNGQTYGDIQKEQQSAQLIQSGGAASLVDNAAYQLKDGILTKTTDANGKHSYTFSNNDGKTVTTNDRGLEKAAGKANKDAQKKLDKLQQSQAMYQKNTVGYGGQYGGESKEKTQAINQAAQMVTGTMNQLMVATTTSQNTNVNTSYAANATTNTQSDYNNAQAKMMRNNGKANIMMGTFEALVAAGQEVQAEQHTASINKVQQSARTAMLNLNTAVAVNQQGAAKSNVETNLTNETKAQKQLASTQRIRAAGTAANAILTVMQGIKLQQAANVIATQPTPTGPQFTIGNNNPMANPTPDQAALTTPGSVVADDTTTPPDLPTNGDAFNPDLPTGPMAGQSPSQGGMGAPVAPQGDSGSGLASAGGTSAASDDKKADTAALTKNAEGTYSPSDDAGSKFSRAGGMGGGSGVGVDNGFADLLKKFLPGGDEDKKGQDNLNFGSDRSPASDQAAVLGRNQNIFEAIHKRYEKKQAEGAIIFAGEKRLIEIGSFRRGNT